MIPRELIQHISSFVSDDKDKRVILSSLFSIDELFEICIENDINISIYLASIIVRYRKPTSVYGKFIFEKLKNIENWNISRSANVIHLKIPRLQIQTGPGRFTYRSHPIFSESLEHISRNIDFTHNIVNDQIVFSNYSDTSVLKAFYNTIITLKHFSTGLLSDLWLD